MSDAIFDTQSVLYNSCTNPNDSIYEQDLNSLSIWTYYLVWWLED